MADGAVCGRDERRRGGSGDEAHHLIHGDCQDCEHEVAEDLGVAAHADGSAAEVVLEAAVDALDGAALAVAHRLRRLMAGVAAAFLLGVQGLFGGAAARARLDDRDVAERAAVGPDLRGISGAS